MRSRGGRPAPAIQCFACGNRLTHVRLVARWQRDGKLPWVVSCRCGAQLLILEARPKGDHNTRIKARKLTTDALKLWAWDLVRQVHPARSTEKDGPA